MYLQRDPGKHATDPRQVSSKVRPSLERLKDIFAVWFPVLLFKKTRALSIAVFHNGVGGEAVEGASGVEPPTSAIRKELVTQLSRPFMNRTVCTHYLGFPEEGIEGNTTNAMMAMVYRSDG